MADQSTTLHLIKSNEDGQSVVEYILLLMVISTIIFALFKSNTFQDFMGDNSSFFNSVRKRLEYSYRHGTNGTDHVIDYNGYHDLYWNKETNNTRFFAPRGTYPN